MIQYNFYLLRNPYENQCLIIAKTILRTYRSLHFRLFLANKFERKMSERLKTVSKMDSKKFVDKEKF